jgi:hypothetical protein
MSVSSAPYDFPTHTISLPKAKPATETVIIEIPETHLPQLNSQPTVTVTVMNPIPTPLLRPTQAPPPKFFTSTKYYELPNTLRHADNEMPDPDEYKAECAVMPYGMTDMNEFNKYHVSFNRADGVKAIDSFCANPEFSWKVLQPGHSDRQEYTHQQGRVLDLRLDIEYGCDWQFDLEICQQSFRKIVDECDREGENNKHGGEYRPPGGCLFFQISSKPVWA